MHYEDRRDADDAIKRLDGEKLLGEKIVVQSANGRCLLCEEGESGQCVPLGRGLIVIGGNRWMLKFALTVAKPAIGKILQYFFSG